MEGKKRTIFCVSKIRKIRISIVKAEKVVFLRKKGNQKKNN